MTTNKQKKALRVRQKIANRQPTKEKQIRDLMKKVDNLPVNPLTGEPIFPQDESLIEGIE